MYNYSILQTSSVELYSYWIKPYSTTGYYRRHILNYTHAEWNQMYVTHDLILTVKQPSSGCVFQVHFFLGLKDIWKLFKGIFCFYYYHSRYHMIDKNVSHILKTFFYSIISMLMLDLINYSIFRINFKLFPCVYRNISWSMIRKLDISTIV